MYPGMLPHLKPEYIDMELLRRQTTTAGKAKFKGLPHKHNLAVPMLKKFVEHTMSMLPRRELEAFRVLYGHGESSGEAWPGNPSQRTARGILQGSLARESRSENPPGNSLGEAAQGIPVRD